MKKCLIVFRNPKMLLRPHFISLPFVHFGQMSDQYQRVVSMEPDTWNLAGPSSTRKPQRPNVFKAGVFTRVRLAARNMDLCRFKWSPGYGFPSTSLQGTSTVMMSDVQSASWNLPPVFTLLQSHCGRGPESRVQQEIEGEMEEIRT